MKKKTHHKGSISCITVNINVICDAVYFDRRRIIKMVRQTAGRFGIKKAHINFAVLGDKGIIDINKKFLRKKTTTDVISFDLSESSGLRIFDIAANAEMAKRQAKIRKCGPQSELALYFIHGLLHNFGFDDSVPAKAAKMHKTEDEILKEFGYGIVYKSKPRQ